MVLGYAYPAYECFKTVEKNKPEIEQLRFWCQYWILVAALTVFERVGDTFVSWLPMYSEAKLAFFIYLWYPKTMGTTYVYNTFLRPYVAKHETQIDRNLMELRARAGDIAVLYWHRAASYGQTRIFEILQYVASQSPRTRPAQKQQQQQQHGGARQPVQMQTRQPPPTPTRQSASQQSHQPSPHQPANMAASQKQASAQETGTIPAPVGSTVPIATAPTQATTEASTTRSVSLGEGEEMQVESALVVPNGGANPAEQKTVMEEAIRVTRGRLRKSRSAANR